MIIPIKCVTCGTVLADKYRFYLENVREKKLAQGVELNETIYLTENSIDKTAEGQVLDMLKLNKYVVEDTCLLILILNNFFR